MSDTATCAVCGEIKELCGSIRMSGITQPRLCPECLALQMRGECRTTDPAMWMIQLVQLNDTESIEAIRAELNERSRT